MVRTLTSVQAYWESAAAAQEKELHKRQEKAIKKWQRLIQGMQIRSRLQEQYGNGPAGQVSHSRLDDVPRTGSLIYPFRVAVNEQEHNENGRTRPAA
jgi:hypothetical protein